MDVKKVLSVVGAITTLALSVVQVGNSAVNMSDTLKNVKESGGASKA